MAKTTVDWLLQRAYRIIGLNSNDRNLSGAKIQEGLDILNELLDSFFAEPDMIAYFDEVQFNLVTGQKSYEFSNEVTADVTSNKIAQLKSVNIIDSNTSYPMWVQKDFIDWEVRRVTDRQTRPSQCYLQNENFKSFLIFDVLPDKNYICKVKAKFALSNVALSTDLETVPIYYTKFLTLATGRELNSMYPGSIWNDKLEARYEKAKRNITQTSDDDLMQITNVGLSSTYRYRHWGINPY
jgi:hypothetical protein